MNLLFPRYRKNRNCDRRIFPARSGLGTFPLLVVCAIFWSGSLAFPIAARAQSDASHHGSQPELAPPAGGAKAGTTSSLSKAYIIGPNDVLEVKVWNQPQISSMYDVHLDGMINLPLVGEIKADGLTQTQLKEAITKRLEEVLTTPEVNVSVVKINSKHYKVYGAVQRQGEFTLAERVTLMDALSQSQIRDGFAKTTNIELRRGGKTFRFNEKDYLNGKNMDKNINYELQDGDEIIVHE